MEEIDSLTFTRWTVFNAIEPEPLHRADLHNARLLAMLRNVNSSSSSPPVYPKDYMLDYWDRVAQMKVDEKKQTKNVLAFLSGIPGVKVTVLKPEVLEDEHN